GEVGAAEREVTERGAGAVGVHGRGAVGVEHVQHLGTGRDRGEVGGVRVLHRHRGRRRAAGRDREDGVVRRVRAHGDGVEEERLVAGRVHGGGPGEGTGGGRPGLGRVVGEAVGGAPRPPYEPGGGGRGAVK